ncbi:MAG TPA: UDP-glucose 4-epimerase GalE [Acetobacteraceae bacterium]|jgi:UDP-arabinose 4-epimerase|nr:UDP-glucose 4-epimerase GalE [Acetobacteraceae bacterium]
MSDTANNGRVLVVGGGGYIGSHAAKALVRAGFEPVVYDNFSRGHRSLARFGPVYEGDIHDRRHLDEVLRETRPVGCLHFAAYAYVAESIASPELYYRNNVAGSLTLFDALLAAGVAAVVFSSSCATYGQTEVMPITEQTPQRPISPYGRSKLMVEQMLRDMDAAHGLRSVSLRYFNACGADPDGEVGEMHNPEPHIIPRAIMAAVREQAHFAVNGVDYPTPDGTAVRDYTHVTDLADAHISALHHLLGGGGTEALNLGIGRGYSVMEVLRSVEHVTGRLIDVRTAARREGDPASVVADASRAREVLGFNPRFVALDDMVRTAWSWFRANGFRHD